MSPFLRSKGIRTIDKLVISHPQEDHIGGLFTVLEDFRVLEVVHAGKPYGSQVWKKLQEQLAKEGSHELIVGRGDSLQAPRGVDIRVLHPLKDALSKNINDDSVVLKVECGADSFLMTGDIQTPAIRSLLLSGQDLEADVLKVPHHGARLNAQGAAFVQAVRPKVSLISAGARNPFGHPAPETLEALNAVPGDQVLRTDENGFISVRPKDGALVVSP